MISSRGMLQHLPPTRLIYFFMSVCHSKKGQSKYDVFQNLKKNKVIIFTYNTKHLNLLDAHHNLCVTHEKCSYAICGQRRP